MVENSKTFTGKVWYVINRFLRHNLQFLFSYIDKTLIIRYIHACRGDLDKTKALIELSFSMRNKNPNIFLKRDPMDAESQNVFRVT